MDLVLSYRSLKGDSFRGNSRAGTRGSVRRASGFVEIAEFDSLAELMFLGEDSSAYHYEVSDLLPKVDSMRERVTLASFLTLGCVLLRLAAANFFPDQTWRALTMAQTPNDGIVSRINR